MQITARRMYYHTFNSNGVATEHVTTATSGVPSAWLYGEGDVSFKTNSAKNGWIVSGTVQIKAYYAVEIYTYGEQYFVARLEIYEGTTKIGTLSLDIKEDLVNRNGTYSSIYTFADKEIIPTTRSTSNLYVKLVIDFTRFISSGDATYGKAGVGYDSMNALIKRSESNLNSATVEQLPPLLSPPTISNLINNNPYNSQSGISASTNSISLKWNSTGDAIAKSWYKVDSNAWVELAAVTSCDIPNLSPGTSYTIQVQCSNDAGDSNVLSITIRTRHDPPIVALSLKSVDLETLTFNWSSNKDLGSTQYKIDSGEWTNLGQAGLSGTFTTKWFDPKTKHTIYFKGVSTSTYDTLNSNESNASGTTYDRAHIQSIGECIFGLNINLQLQSESEKLLKLQIWTEGNSRKPLFEFDNITKGLFTFTPTQDQLDQMYKCFTNQNEIPIHFLLTTHGDWKDWNDTESEKSLQLTGIAKTAHIGIDNKPRRAQVWIGDENNKPRRAVAWQGIDNKPRRCI